MKYRTREGDVLDAVCLAYYGAGNFSVEEVYAANPGLAAHGPILEPGLLIELPAQAAIQREAAAVKLWD